MTTPTASCPLTKGRGTLSIPVRGDYEAIMARTGDAWELRLGRGGEWTHTPLLFVPAMPEIDGVPGNDPYYHSEIRIEGYRYGVRIVQRDGKPVLELLDGLIQPHTGPSCAVDENGRVVVSEEPKRGRKRT